MLIDLHAHTWPRSHDSVLSPDDLVVRAKKAGLDAIVFTEHDTLWDYTSVQALCEKHNFLVMAGVEISTDDDDMLAFGIDNYVFGMHRSDHPARHVDSADGVLVAAHHYRRQIPWYIRNVEEYDQALQRRERTAAGRGCQGSRERRRRGCYLATPARRSTA